MASNTAECVEDYFEKNKEKIPKMKDLDIEKFLERMIPKIE